MKYVQTNSNKMRKDFLKGQFPYFSTALLSLIAIWTILSNIEMSNFFIDSFLMLWLIGFICYMYGLFNLNLFMFSLFYFILILTILSLSIFLIGLLSKNQNLIDQGFALGIPPTLGWSIAIIGIYLSTYILYRRFRSINYDYYFKETLAAKNYDLENKLYFINQISNEPELNWKFFNAPGKSGISKLEYLFGLISILLPIGTGSAYITLMSQYSPFTLHRITFYLSLPAFLFFGFISIMIYVRYRSYKLLQKELRTKLKPAIKA
jgi:hypothetical protein